MGTIGRISRADFKQLAARRPRRAAGRFTSLSLYAGGPLRYTCVVSKKTAAKAAERNRLKRRCREAARLALADVPEGAFVFRPLRPALRAPFAELAQDVRALVLKAVR